MQARRTPPSSRLIASQSQLFRLGAGYYNLWWRRRRLNDYPLSGTCKESFIVWRSPTTSTLIEASTLKLFALGTDGCCSDGAVFSVVPTARPRCQKGTDEADSPIRNSSACGSLVCTLFVYTESCHSSRICSLAPTRPVVVARVASSRAKLKKATVVCLR